MTNFTPQPAPVQELRDLLGAIHATLAVAPPARGADDDAYRRAFAHRAVLVHVAVDNFLASPKYDEVVQLVKEQREGAAQ